MIFFYFLLAWWCGLDAFLSFSFSTVVVKWGLYQVIRACGCSLMESSHHGGGMTCQLLPVAGIRQHGQEHLQERVVQNWKINVVLKYA